MMLSVTMLVQSYYLLYPRFVPNHPESPFYPSLSKSILLLVHLFLLELLTTSTTELPFGPLDTNLGCLAPLALPSVLFVAVLLPLL